MRLLLIAYEFPPSPSPQSLRWTYLARELDALGHEVHVLAPDLGGETPGLPGLPPGIVVHRTFAGPFRGLMAMRRRQRQRRAGAGQNGGQRAPGAPAVALRPPRNWKQRISETVQKTLEAVIFPDLRGEWKPWAKPALRALLDGLRPDLVISSHEPATTLELGLLAHARGIRWAVDIADPVLAGYTPRRWRRRASRLERETCERADLVVVTNDAAAALLRERHGAPDRCLVLTQGFDLRPATIAAEGVFDESRLELFYSGSLYRFRRIDQLLSALAANPRARLNIAAITVPEHILDFAAKSPQQVRLLGFLPHDAILAMQRRAHVLVNIANDDSSQVPGKVFEYLGAGRPILHLGAGDDPIATLLREHRRGWVCRNDAEALSAQLASLVRAQATGELERGLELGADAVAAYSWQAGARRLDEALRKLPIAGH
jgi:glycosyltransferase involved in cell wall biosynthesis